MSVMNRLVRRLPILDGVHGPLRSTWFALCILVVIQALHAVYRGFFATIIYYDDPANVSRYARQIAWAPSLEAAVRLAFSNPDPPLRSVPLAVVYVWFPESTPEPLLRQLGMFHIAFIYYVGMTVALFFIFRYLFEDREALVAVVVWSGYHALIDPFSETILVTWYPAIGLVVSFFALAAAVRAVMASSLRRRVTYCVLTGFTMASAVMIQSQIPIFTTIIAVVAYLSRRRFAELLVTGTAGAIGLIPLSFAATYTSRANPTDVLFLFHITPSEWLPVLLHDVRLIDPVILGFDVSAALILCFLHFGEQIDLDEQPIIAASVGLFVSYGIFVNFWLVNIFEYMRLITHPMMLAALSVYVYSYLSDHYELSAGVVGRQ